MGQPPPPPPRDIRRLPSPRIHPSSVIGGEPQSRDFWLDPGQPVYHPNIHETARVGPLCQIDSGIQRHTTIGAHSWILGMCHVGHDVLIGEGCEVASGTVIAGHCEVGNNVRIGVNATLRPFVKVGDGARIGAGSVVVKDVAAGTTVYGNPARPRPKPVEFRQGFPDAA